MEHLEAGDQQSSTSSVALDPVFVGVIGCCFAVSVLLLTIRVCAAATARERQITRHYLATNNAKVVELIDQSPSLGDNSRLHLLKGLALLRMEQREEGLATLEKDLESAEEPYRSLMRQELADCYYADGNYRLAEAHYREYLAHYPLDPLANQRLMRLLQAQGRTWESLEFARNRVLSGRFTGEELAVLALPESHWLFAQDLYELRRERYPEELLNDLALVRQAALDDRLAIERERLEAMANRYPRQIEVLAWLGQLYFETGDRDRFVAWNAGLPDEANSHPHVWYLRGMWEKDQNQYQKAAGCFLRAQLCSASHSRSQYQLVQMVRNEVSEDLQPLISKHVRARAQIASLTHDLTTQLDSKRVYELVAHLETVEQWMQAAAWCEVLYRFQPQEQTARELFLKYRHKWMTSDESDSSGMLKELESDLGIAVASAPHELSPSLGSGQFDEEATSQQSNLISFAEVANEAGIDFEYFADCTDVGGEHNILTVTGGGIAVLDYDDDGWPDFYFIQSGNWSQRGRKRASSNKLYRNLGDGRFVDVTREAGLGSTEYGQGVTAGDLDNDGDTDLVVCNVGPNQLFLNEGDGTFRDVSDAFSTVADEWTTSGAMADVNNDGLLDLYLANYVPIEAALEKRCAPRSCSPQDFAAAQDHVFLNLGDGRFREGAEAWGLVATNGKGLGVIAADFDGDRKIEIFVGNDTAANFYFDQSDTGSSGNSSYSNEAVLAGVAVNENGQTQASMGIAATDFDGNGLLDLYITNFYADASTFYRQSSPGMFSEATRQLKLRDSSFHLLGFGCQFMDADGDGDADLLVSNGHVDMSWATGEPDLMRPQLLVNANGGYREQESALVGPYFEGKYFGRAVATCDWNRDGRLDAVISHLDDPVALLRNETPQVLPHLRLTLIGTASSREGTGARVRMRQGDRIEWGFATSGDGYLCSNERIISFAVEPNVMTTLTVYWPSGKEDEWEIETTDSSAFFCVEGQGVPLAEARD